jgi:predicted transcriptional regulator of viral defense system
MKFMSKKKHTREMLTVAQVAEMLGISYAAALRRVEVIPGVLHLRVPGQTQHKRMLRIPRKELEAYIRECSTTK